MPLSDLQVRNAKPGEKDRKVSDGGGLHLLVKTDGARYWRLAYRFGGKQKLLALGVYPEVSLLQARKSRDAAKDQLKADLDPSAERKREKLLKQITDANTFGGIADEYLAKLAADGRAEATLNKVTWLLEFARPALSDRPITKISAAEVLAVLREVERRGRLESARRLRSTVGSVFRYAIATTRAENDPTVALRGALTTPQPVARAAVTEPKALGALLRAIDSYQGQPETHAALRLMALLFPRPGELRAAEWAEFDLDQAVWIIPAARTKMRRPHRVPLPPQAISVLKELHEITGRGKLAFPSVRSSQRCISENTLNAALRRLGYAKDEATAHGFRATASTLLNECGKWNPDAIERQLAHVESNAVRRAYTRGEHWDERMLMMAWWADYLDGLRTGGEVIPLRGRG